MEAVQIADFGANTGSYGGYTVLPRLYFNGLVVFLFERAFNCNINIQRNMDFIMMLIDH